MIIDFHTHMFPDKIAKQTIDKLSECSGKAPDTDEDVEYGKKTENHGK